ncbi:MAG: hypothetical protein NC418_05100 [Muribaculaceae bacterium]|nr:hypothetical protein [Muribaculaceae bacterium]
MRIFTKFKSASRSICHISLIKTLRVNLRFFPVKTALKFPVIILKGTSVTIGKTASLTLTCAPAPGLLRLGGLDIRWHPKGVRSNVAIEGSIVLSGRAYFGYNSNIIVGKDAALELGGENYLNHDLKLLVHEKVSLGYGARVGWNTQICDTAFHYVAVDDVVSRKTKPVVIGREAWVSSYCNVGRGAVLPDYSILSTYSLLNKDYTKDGPHILLGGIPAKLIKTNVTRIMETVGNNAELCDAIEQYFNSHPGEMRVNISQIITTNENR